MGQDVGGQVALIAKQCRLQPLIVTRRLVHFPRYMPVMAVPPDGGVLLGHRDVGGEVAVKEINRVLGQQTGNVGRQQVEGSQDIYASLDMRGWPPGDCCVGKT